MDTIKPLLVISEKAGDSIVEKVLPVISEPIVSVIISSVIFINIIDTFLRMPRPVQMMVNHPVVKVMGLFLVLYFSDRNFNKSVLTTAGIVVLYLIYKKREEFELIKESPSDYPGCSNVTVKDLLDLFKGDESKLKSTMYESGIPLDVQLTDVNAPRIATYLMNHRIQVSESCRAPE